jgi:hypothetical protein
MIGADQDWRRANRANWTSGSRFTSKPMIWRRYEPGAGGRTRSRRRRLGSVERLRVLHLQRHFGGDSLILAQRGAQVVGLDLSAPAIAAARELAAGLTLRWLHEHEAAPWRTFEVLVEDASGMDRWPERPWLPLAVLAARRTSALSA